MSTTHNSLKRHWRILLASTLAVVFVATLVATALDSDNDGMQDDYEPLASHSLLLSLSRC